MNAHEVVSAVFGDTDNATLAVDHVFAVLEATYGPAWDRIKGVAPIGTVKTVWAFHLGNFTHSKNAKRAILWALKNLPEAPPNAVQFSNLCRSAPGVPAALELPRPPLNPEIVKAIVSGIKSAPASPHGMKDWAFRLKARHEAGEKLNPNQIRCYQGAIGMVA